MLGRYSSSDGSFRLMSKAATEAVTQFRKEGGNIAA